MSLTFERIEQNKVTGHYKKLSDALSNRNALKEVVSVPKHTAIQPLSTEVQLLTESVRWYLQRFEVSITNLRNLIQSLYNYKYSNYGNR